MIVAREDALAAYADGVEAVERAAGNITDWAAPTPCVEWRAVDLAGHLLAIARYYHRLLDAAAAAVPAPGFPVARSCGR